jgi:hypothetical protein
MVHLDEQKLIETTSPALAGKVAFDDQRPAGHLSY